MKNYFTEEMTFQELTKNLLLTGWALLGKGEMERGETQDLDVKKSKNGANLYRFGRLTHLPPYGVAIETVGIKKPEKLDGYVFDPIYTIRIQGCEDWARLLFARPTRYDDEESCGSYIPADEPWSGELPEMPGLDIDRDYSNSPLAHERELLPLSIGGIPSVPEGKEVVFVPNGKVGEIFTEKEIEELLNVQG